jgi:hypothetical protein
MCDRLNYFIRPCVFRMLMSHKTMLGGSLVTTAWRVLRLRVEETPSTYGG